MELGIHILEFKSSSSTSNIMFHYENFIQQKETSTVYFSIGAAK